jgi:spore coat protein U-like protein
MLMRMIGNTALSGALLLAGAMSLAVGSEPARAATASAAIVVSATVLSFCTSAAMPLVFGNYSSVLLNANTTVTIACTATTPYNVGLSVGAGTGATVALREMTNGSSSLGYELFSDAAYKVPWGPTVGTNTVAGVATGLTTNLVVYGQIPANELATPGGYLDTVTATITY